MFLKKIFDSDRIVRADIDVLILGNRAVGKTSLLATMLYKMNEKLRPNGITFESADEETDRKLKESISKIEQMFLVEDSVGVGVGIDGTDRFEDYNFQLKFIDDSNEVKKELSSFKLIFHDHEGSVLAEGEKGGWQYQQLHEKFMQSQIIYVLVEAPYLMELSKRDEIAEISAKKEILKLFQELGENCGEKLIVVVPTKCEYYLRNNRITELLDKLQREFKDLIDYISQINKSGNRKRIRLYVTPIQTVGGLEFARMKYIDGVGSVPDFRRTMPNSRFNPKQTDLLLLFCMEYLLDCFFDEAANGVSIKNMKTTVEKMRKQDDEKKLSDCYTIWDELIQKGSDQEKQKKLFRDMLYSFFQEYNDRESVIKGISENETVQKCQKLYSSKRKIEDGFSKQFEQYFTEIYVQ